MSRDRKSTRLCGEWYTLYLHCIIKFLGLKIIENRYIQGLVEKIMTWVFWFAFSKVKGYGLVWQYFILTFLTNNFCHWKPQKWNDCTTFVFFLIEQELQLMLMQMPIKITKTSMSSMCHKLNNSLQSRTSIAIDQSIGFFII